MVVLGPGVGGEGVCLRGSGTGVFDLMETGGGLKVPSRIASTAASVASSWVMAGWADVRAVRRRPAMKGNRIIDRWRSLM